MTVVVGTAGHIDHGKTALLRALTGIDADRLPEERRRGMTIDVGYSHLGLPDGSELDFVDVPGHDKLVGNMLVGAGEIDAAMLVVAAEDGPRAQTFEHLDLLDALQISDGIAVVTKIDLVDRERVGAVQAELSLRLARTSLAKIPFVAVSSVSGAGIDRLRAELLALRDRVEARAATRPRPRGSRLAIDRVFSVKGRGLVVTGTLRGGPLEHNTSLRVVPGGGAVRARGLQVHSRAVEVAERGRTAINVSGVDDGELHRGMVLTDDPLITATDRILVAVQPPLGDGTRARLHLGTASVDAIVGRGGRDALDLPNGAGAAVLRLATPVAAAPGDRFLLRRVGGETPVGGIVLDVAPARGVSRRRQTPERVASLLAAVERDHSAAVGARVELHGAIAVGGAIKLAKDVADDVAAHALTVVPPNDTIGLGAARALTAGYLRRRVTIRRDDALRAASAVVDGLLEAGRLMREGDRICLPGVTAPNPDDDPELTRAMDRLEALLAHPTPPPLREAAARAGCPEAGVRLLERRERIVVLEPDLAYATGAYRGLERQALDLASARPLTPAAFRDATGTSRKYVMAILEDLDRRGILRRTDVGHVPGPRAGAVAGAVGMASRRP